MRSSMDKTILAEIDARVAMLAMPQGTRESLWTQIIHKLGSAKYLGQRGIVLGMCIDEELRQQEIAMARIIEAMGFDVKCEAVAVYRSGGSGTEVYARCTVDLSPLYAEEE
jgi:hypothetical protein